MAIGKVIDPSVMNAIIAASEGQQNRNLEAAIADRKLKLAAQQANQEAKLKASGLSGAKDSAKLQIEQMKEQGRMERAQKALEIKAKAEGRLGEGASFLNALREAQASGLLGKEGRADARHPLEMEGLGADVAGKKTENQIKLEKLAKIRQELWDLQTTSKDRARLIKNNADLVGERVQDIPLQREMKAKNDAFARAMKIEGVNARRKAMWTAMIQWKNKIDMFGRTLGSRLQENPDAKIAYDNLMTMLRVASFEDSYLYEAWKKKFGDTLGLDAAKDEVLDDEGPSATPLQAPVPGTTGTVAPAGALDGALGAIPGIGPE